MRMVVSIHAWSGSE